MKKILITLVALMALSLVYTSANATPGCDHPNFYVEGCEYDFTGPQGPAGPQGETGPMGPAGPIGLTGPAGADGADGVMSQDQYDELLNDNRLANDRVIGGVVAVAAIAMIPDARDGHTAIGIGFTTYRGVEGIALGITHKVDNLNLTAAISTSSAERDVVIGAGASASF